MAWLDLEDYSFEVEASEGVVWAVAQVDVHSPDWNERLVRVDPATNRVVGYSDGEGASGLAIGGDAVWLSTSNVEEGTLTKITL